MRPPAREIGRAQNWHGWMAPQAGALSTIPHRLLLLLDHRGAPSHLPVSHQLRVGAQVLTASSHCTIVLLETGTGTVSISSPRSLRFAATDRPPVSFHRFKDTQEDTGGSWDTQRPVLCPVCVPVPPETFYTVVSTCTSSSSGALAAPPAVTHLPRAPSSDFRRRPP